MNKQKNVYLYWPNLVDYARLVLWIIFLWVAFYHPITALVLYIILDNLDAVDGVLARKLNQVSKLGTALDFAIDRITIASLLLILAKLYPSLWLLFCLLMALDLGSHFIHLYSTSLSGAASHKKLEDHNSRLLERYYNHRVTLFSICFFYDAFLLAAFMFHFYPNNAFTWIMVACFPGFFVKLVVHILQINAACRRLVNSTERG
jgi:CDP-diacylglycerol--inositol 3-phosphatidyltransferase